jgi:MICOS complex subunit MIC26
MKSLIAPNEPLTPGLLYAGVAALTGSVLARNRALPLRLLLPPTLLTLAFAHFLPQTAHNVRAYAGALEDRYLPGVAEKHEIGKAHAGMAWARLRESLREGREGLGKGVEGALDRVQEGTGLKVREALGARAKETEGVMERARAQALQGVQTAERKAEEAREVVVDKIEAAREVIAEKTEQAREVVEAKAEEVRKEVAEKVEEAKAVVEEKKAEEQRKPEQPAKRLV